MCEKVVANEVEKHIGVLDGIRAVAIIMVVWFHFWQQTWLTPYITFDNSLLQYIGITQINIADFVRYGAIFVDVLIFLSAFCNFYPYARAILLGEMWPDTKRFYFKRAARILPSYYFAVAVMFCFAVSEGAYEDNLPFMWKDLLTHLFCIAPFWKDTYVFSKLNGVLWTVQVEVLYYIIMPLLARFFKKSPLLTYMAMMGISVITVQWILIHYPEVGIEYVNHILTFMGVYANGILTCFLFLAWKMYVKENPYTRMASSVIMIYCVILMNKLVMSYNAEEMMVRQLGTRIEQSFFVAGIVFFSGTSYSILQKLLDNRIMNAICVISYNLYLWHQFIAVKMKEYRIPYWEGEVPPNMTGNTRWQIKYQILILVNSLVIAWVTTCLIEKPMRKYILKETKGNI